MFDRFRRGFGVDLTAEISDRETVDKVRHLEQSLISGNMSRRGFMTYALALGVSMTTASAYLNTVEAATPKKGGRYRQGVTGGATSDTLDPGQILDHYMLNVRLKAGMAVVMLKPGHSLFARALNFTMVKPWTPSMLLIH